MLMKNRILIFEGLIIISYLLQVRYFFRILEVIPMVSPSFWWLPLGLLLPALFFKMQQILLQKVVYYKFFRTIFTTVKIYGQKFSFKRISFGTLQNLGIFVFNTILFAIPYYILRN
jgi:hypothetical protein